MDIFWDKKLDEGDHRTEKTDAKAINRLVDTESQKNTLFFLPWNKIMAIAIIYLNA